MPTMTVYRSDLDCSRLDVAEDAGVGEAQLTPHGDRAGVDGLVGSGLLDRFEQTLCSPALQPDEFDGSIRPLEDLTRAG